MRQAFHLVGAAVAAGMTLACSASDATPGAKGMANGSETGGTPDESDPLPPSATLTLEPEMLRTGLGAAVTASVSARFDYSPLDQGRSPVDAVLQAFATGAVEATDGTYTVPSAGNPGVFRLTPSAPLADGWYAFVVEVPAAARVVGDTMEGPSGPLLRDDGKYESRFRVGSDPRVLAVAACASKNDGLLPKLIVSFSEPVTVPTTPPVTVTADGLATTCTKYMQDSDWPLSVGLTCNPAMPVDADISVAVAEGVVSAASGAAVKDGAGRTSFMMRLPARENPSIVCRNWRETRPPETLTP